MPQEDYGCCNIHANVTGLNKKKNYIVYFLYFVIFFMLFLSRASIMNIKRDPLHILCMDILENISWIYLIKDVVLSHILWVIYT